jgi:hypothetical protein
MPHELDVGGRQELDVAVCPWLKLSSRSTDIRPTRRGPWRPACLLIHTSTDSCQTWQWSSAEDLLSRGNPAPAHPCGARLCGPFDGYVQCRGGRCGWPASSCRSSKQRGKARLEPDRSSVRQPAPRPNRSLPPAERPRRPSRSAGGVDGMPDRLRPSSRRD